MEAAFGKGTKVVDVFTGREYIDEVAYDWAHGYEPHRSYVAVKVI